ncbi:hypothetical protein ABFS82_13G138000 [Erythranthe guttata]
MIAAKTNSGKLKLTTVLVLLLVIVLFSVVEGKGGGGGKGGRGGGGRRRNAGGYPRVGGTPVAHVSNYGWKDVSSAANVFAFLFPICLLLNTVEFVRFFM